MASEVTFRATPPSSRFLELPLEIRDCIYTYLLVEEDTFREEDEAISEENDRNSLGDIDESSSEGRVSSRDESVSVSTTSSAVDTDESIYPQIVHGAVLISELHPGKFMAGMKSIYWTSNWDLDGREQRTTYFIGPDIDLRLFCVCRQIYEEATYIFYTKNRFYVESIEALGPFLKDLSSRSRALLKTLSIPVPCGTQREEDGERIKRYYRVNDSTFEAACRLFSKAPELLANVKQLDLRMWEFDTSYSSRVSSDPNTLKISAKRAKQLASIADPRVMTLSFRDWQRVGGSGPIASSIFEPLPSHIHRKIQRFREDHLWGTHSPELDPIEGEDDDSGPEEDNDDDHYMSWMDILMGRRGTNAI